MRVLYYHQHFSTPAGAAGTRSYEFARRLVRAGHSVIMVCGHYNVASTGLAGEFVRGRRRGTVDEIDVIEFNLSYSNRQGFFFRSLTFFRFALRSIGVALREEYDLVFATSTPLTAGIPGIFARLLRRKPFVFEVRDLWPELPKQMGVIRNPLVLGAMRLLERMTYRAANACVGLSPGIVNGIRETAGHDKSVRMIPNGCDLELFRNAEERKKVVPVTAVFAGAHGLANGLDAILDAAVELKKRGRNDISLRLIGDGSQKPRLLGRAARQGLKNCEFEDPIPKSVLAREFEGFHIGLQVLADVPGFYYGTSPNKFFDYLAAGLPVITNYPGWVAELIEQHNCGIGVPPEDAIAFADAIEHLAVHPETRARMGQNARRLAERRFDRQQLADEFVEFLEGLAPA
jgi:glycosyltransferase involved in cell wall biosynthesis